jgi:choline kinase
MRGIILAAGKGSRLNGAAGESPKCLVKAGGLTLVDRQIRALRNAGIDDIAVVVGCQADQVRRACGQELPTLRIPSTPRPTACIRCGWHDLCYLRGSWS